MATDSYFYSCLRVGAFGDDNLVRENASASLSVLPVVLHILPKLEDCNPL